MKDHRKYIRWYVSPNTEFLHHVHRLDKFRTGNTDTH